MVCVSTDNPITMMLEVTEADCVQSNQDIAVQIETRGSEMPRPYARDLAITAVICFIGGIGLTLLAVLIYYQVSHKKKLKEGETQKEEEEGRTAVFSNHISEKRRDVFLQASSSQPLDREAMMFENHGGQFLSRVDEDGGHFRCLDCTKSQRGVWPNQMRLNNGINREMEAEEERENRRMRMMTEVERRKLGIQQGTLSRDIPKKLPSLGNSNSFTHPWRETFDERPETLSDYKTDRNKDSYRTDVEGRSNGYENLHCKSCHRTYRPPEQTMRPGRTHTNMRDSALIDSFSLQHRLIDKGRNVNHNQFDMMKDTELRRETRHVKFDLEGLRILVQGKDKRGERGRTSRDKEKRRIRRQKGQIQSSRQLKVKLNLSPLRKSKVHPKRKTEQGDKSSSKKSKEKREDGKEREEKEGKPKSGKKTKGGSEKMKKSTKSTGSSEEEKGKKDDREGKSKTTSKQKKTTSKCEENGNEATAGDQELTHPVNSQSGDTTIADQSASAITTRQGQHLQGGSIQYQEAGLVLRNAQRSSQHPFSLSATEKNHTTNLSLLGSAGSHLTGSSLSLQRGNIQLNAMTPGSNALLPNGQANSVAPCIGIGGASLVSPATSLLANTVHANPLQASGIQTTPLHKSQAGGPSMNLASYPAMNPVPNQSLSQIQLPPGSSPLVAGLKYDPAQGPGLQTAEGLHQAPPQSQAPQSKESLIVQAQASPSAHGLSEVNCQALGSSTTVEHLSDNNGQTGTGHVAGGSAGNMLAGAVALTEGPAVGVSGDNMETAVSGASVPSTSTQTGSSTGGADGADGAAAATALLQQEYVTEEGGSSPRRKLRLVLPEKTSSRPPTALERKIR